MATSYRRPKARAVGLAIGSFWLVAVGGGFVAWSLFAMSPVQRTGAFAWLALFYSCLIAGALVLRKALRLPPDIEPRTETDKQIGKRFLIVFGAELASFAIVNPIVAVGRHFAMLPALNLIIIGLHFIPLAWIFQVRRYYWLGILFCGISVATLAVFPQTEMVGQALVWAVVPGAGCGLVAVVTGTIGLFESLGITNAVRGSARQHA